MKLRLVGIALLLFAGCGQSPQRVNSRPAQTLKSQPAPNNPLESTTDPKPAPAQLDVEAPPEAVIALNTSGGRGGRGSTILLFADGTVRRGHQNHVGGESVMHWCRGNLAPKAVDSLLREFRTAGFYSWPEMMFEGAAPDVGETSVTVRSEGQEHTIRHSNQGRGIPGELLALSSKVRSRTNHKHMKCIASPDKNFEIDVEKLRAFGDNHIGPVGGGPVPPGADVVIARKIVAAATPEQLSELLRSPSPALRAHVAREIIRYRPAQLALVRLVSQDSAQITVGSMDDIPPIADLKMTIKELVTHELSYTGRTLPR